jgi:hypothetical protein
MSDDICEYWTEVATGNRYKIVMLATFEGVPIYVMESLDGYLNKAFRFSDEMDRKITHTEGDAEAV